MIVDCVVALVLLIWAIIGVCLLSSLIEDE